MRLDEFTKKVKESDAFDTMAQNLLNPAPEKGQVQGRGRRASNTDKISEPKRGTTVSKGGITKHTAGDNYSGDAEPKVAYRDNRQGSTILLPANGKGRRFN